MKHILIAIILSILIHLIFFYKIKDTKTQTPHKVSTSKQINKTSVRYVSLRKKQKVVKQENKKIIKKVNKKRIKKKTVKKEKYKKVQRPLKKHAKREVLKKTPKEFIRRPNKKVEVTPNFTKLNPTKLQKDTLENFLSKPMNNLKELDALTQSYIKLYGEEYNSFTKVQKVFLEKSLKNIGLITQKYLRYPSVSVITKQQGLNIVEFILQPNGDITEPKIKKSSGYEALDEQTLDTIRTAYKDYPRPKESTKIKIYVNFILY